METIEVQPSLPGIPAESVKDGRFEMSASIGNLIKALAKAREDFKPILKESNNPFFKSKYAALAAVIDATKDGLSANGLAVLQPPAFERATGTVEVMTFLAHSSGEWIKSVLHMPVSKTDAQGVGSAITYGRRYGYSAVLNVASEEDDDGNAAVSKPFNRREVEEQADRAEYLTDFEVTGINDACKRSGKTDEEKAAYLSLIGAPAFEKIQRSGFKSALAWANAKVMPKPKDDPKRTTAMKRLWATAAEFSIPEADVKQASYEKFKVDSMTALSTPQLEEMTVWIKDVGDAASVSTGKTEPF